MARTRATKSRRWRWSVAPPQPNPFAAVAGDLTEHQVRLLEVKARGDSAVEDAVIEVITTVLAHAGDNITKDRRCIVFVWDTVYSTLTVTYCNARRRREGRDVIKLHLAGWDAEIRALRGRKADAHIGLRAWQVQSLLAQFAPPKPILDLLAEHAGGPVTLGYSQDVNGSTFRRLRR